MNIKVGDKVRSIRHHDCMPAGVTGVVRRIIYLDVFVALDPGQNLQYGWRGVAEYDMEETDIGWRFMSIDLKKIDGTPFEKDLTDYLRQELG